MINLTGWVSKVKSNEHFIGLEWLRFFLGLYLVMFHTFHYEAVPSWFRKFFDLGFFATSTFFILSGFLLAHVYLKNHTQSSVALREPSKSFFIKRFSNLYPIHIFSMLLIIVIILIIPHLAIIDTDVNYSIRSVTFDVNNRTPSADLKHYMDNSELILAFIMNFLMIQSWNPYYLMFNFPAWSISTLFFFYLVFPYIAPRLHKIKNPLKGLMILNILYLIPVMLVILTTDFGTPETGILHRNPIIRLPEFMAGILLCSLYHKRKHIPLDKLTKFFMTLFIIASFVGAMYLLAIAPKLSDKGNIPYYILHDGLLLPAQACLIYLFANLKFSNNTKFVSISQKFGGASLPMFALHIPIYMIFTRIERVLSGEPSLCFESFKACFEAAGDKSLLSYPLFLFITIFLCILFQEKFVIKSRKFIQHLLLKN